MSQIDMTDINVVGAGIPVGVSIRILTADPVGQWTLNWAGATTTQQTFNSYGFVCNAYNFYGNPGTYDLSLTVGSGENAPTYNLGKVVARAETPAPPTTSNPEDESGSGAVLDLDVFSDVDFVDELFEI